MKNIFVIFAIVLISLSTNAWSQGDWYWKGSAQGLYRSFSGSDYYDSVTGFGVRLARDYLEQSNVTLGYNYNQRLYRSGLTNAPKKVRENVIYFSASKNHYPSVLSGKLTFRLDAYIGQDDYSGLGVAVPGSMGGGTRSVSIVDNFTAVNPKIAYINLAKTLYADIGVAYSAYSSGDSNNYNINITHSKSNSITGGSSTDDITVLQWTPTIGVGFNRLADWLQLRGYLIDYSSSNRVDFKNSTEALEVKWIHWFSFNSILGLDSASLNILFGERIYAVDSDSYSLYSLADAQKFSVAMGVTWKLDNQLELVAQGGYERYEDLVDNHNYSSLYLFAQVSRNW